MSLPNGAAESGLESLPRREAFLRALFDQAAHGVFITGPTGLLEICNAAGAGMLGYAPAELAGRHFNDVTHPEDRELGLEAMRELRQGRSDHAVFEKRYLRRDGSPIWVRISVTAIRGDGDEIQHFVATIYDITEDRRQQAATLESERRLKGLLEAIPSLLFCVSASGVFLNYKPSRSEELYAPPELFLGKRVDEVLPPEVARPILQAIEAALSGGTVVTVEYRMSMAGIAREYEAQISPYGEGEVVVVVLDVTERRHAEQSRVEAQAALIEAQREALRQLSTPLIPIAAGVIAMPLVGPVDKERAEQMLSTLLDGVAAHRARTVIIDITGVPDVDAEVAGLFARATQVVRLLGAEALLAGVRPDVAQRLISLDVDMKGLRTAGNFQSAMAVALKRREA